MWDRTPAPSGRNSPKNHASPKKTFYFTVQQAAPNDVGGVFLEKKAAKGHTYGLKACKHQCYCIGCFAHNTTLLPSPVGLKITKHLTRNMGWWGGGANKPQRKLEKKKKKKRRSPSFKQPAAFLMHLSSSIPCLDNMKKKKKCMQ